jgi:preprotein translocase SecE subunit
MKEHQHIKKNPIIEYFQESFQELKKVSWPTRNKAVRLTMLVLAFCVVAAVVIGAMDALFSYGHRKLVDMAPPSDTSTVSTQETPFTSETPPVPKAPVTAEAKPPVSPTIVPASNPTNTPKTTNNQ